MRRLVNSQPIDGASACNPASSWAYSGGNASAKVWKDIYGSGQGINAIKKTTSVDELVRKISIEFKEAQGEFIKKANSF